MSSPTDTHRTKGKGIGPPPDVTLPFFAYGALKPGEPAHHQLSPFLDKAPVPAAIQGSLLIRDGLPLLGPGAKRVEGFLLFFAPTMQLSAYQAIGFFEPRAHYHWEVQSSVGAPIVSANVLAGENLSSGGTADLEDRVWTAREDPVFRYGLRIVREVVMSDGNRPFASAPPDDFDWPRFFRLQMAYFLLWSAIERYTTLLFGPELGPVERIRMFGEHKVFRAAFGTAAVTRTATVSDVRDLKPYHLSPNDPKRSILYYYQVRNNLSHRGKGAWKDGEAVRHSLNELTGVFDAVLNGER